VTGFSGDESSIDEQFSLDETEEADPLGVEVVISTNELGESYRLLQMVEPYLPEPGGESEDLGEDNADNQREPDER
jgi:hypothetical protein